MKLGKIIIEVGRLNVIINHKLRHNFDIIVHSPLLVLRCGKFFGIRSDFCYQIMIIIKVFKDWRVRVGIMGKRPSWHSGRVTNCIQNGNKFEAPLKENGNFEFK